MWGPESVLQPSTIMMRAREKQGRGYTAATTGGGFKWDFSNVYSIGKDDRVAKEGRFWSNNGFAWVQNPL